jgi:hypothetical protein
MEGYASMQADLNESERGQKGFQTHENPDELPSKIGRKKVYKEGRTRTFKRTKQMEGIRGMYFSALEGVLISEASEKQVREVIKEYFSKAYAQGVLNSGISTRKTVDQVISKFTDSDKEHVKTAVDEEMGYLRKFMGRVMEGEVDLDMIQKRVKMYVKSLDGIYGSGRVAGLDENTYIHWKPGPESVEKERCPSCKYLMKESPYTKNNLPTTPRAGMTRCLFNCKDVLVAEQVAEGEVQSLDESSKTLETHLTILNRILDGRKAKR